ncbi:hypothetical protein C0993_011500 [Termitomyces sp. T159_Od127]|nr:hypothetical protein C0993_011500 [Termitomyces sp. T159_Od127]
MAGFLMTLKGLPSTYNKDLQEDKEPLFDAVDTVSASFQIAEGVIATLEVSLYVLSYGVHPDVGQIHAEKMRQALTMDVLATDLADYLVRKGIPFRETHHISGRAVALAESRKCQLNELTLEDFKGLNEHFADDIHDVFDFEASVERRESIGGTSRKMIERQVTVLRSILDEQYLSYPTQASGGTGGYQTRRTNVYAHEDDPAYEMFDVKDSRTELAPNANGDGMTNFYSEISSIQENLRTFNDNVARIGDLHSRSLNNMDDTAAQRNASQLDGLVNETSALSNSLKRRIKDLERQGGPGRDGQIRKQQTALVKSKFVEAIQHYQTVEQQYRTKYKQRMERQFKIVKPDATPEEIRAVVNDEQGGQIFSQALLSSNRYDGSRAAYREVQERHEDIKRIEKTLGELAQLFNDMSVLVEQQDETINAVETQAHTVAQDTEAGLGYTEKAVVSARAARKKRWICFFICLIVLIIVGVVVGVVVSNNVNHKLSFVEQRIEQTSDLF